MFAYSPITFFLSFLVLLGSATAANLFRMDGRSPTEVRAAGGLVSWNPAGTGSVLDHGRAKLGKDDPWVSTTSSKTLAKSGAKSAGSVYVYTIAPKSPNKLDIVDLDKAFKKAGEDNPHPGEKEFSVHGSVPWANIISWDTMVRGKKTGTTTRVDFEKGPSAPTSPKSPKSPKKSPKSPKSPTKSGRSMKEFTA
ncbi:cholera enterotoxin subunit A2 protein [Rutstroemia sp. NJR-2017a BVV2]|nr:cholera enterotoxin subunit A2 protein [Rutstroemia sp. NJR-2017a BVV2]